MTRWLTSWSRYLMKTFDDDWQLVILIEMWMLDVVMGVMDMEVDKVAEMLNLDSRYLMNATDVTGNW